MTDRDSRHNQLHYASILPSNTNAYPNQYQRYVIRRSSEPDRSKAVRHFSKIDRGRIW